MKNTSIKDLPERLQTMLRVDQAGEYGAIRIYQGQKDILTLKKKNTAIIQEMQDQEHVHLATFNRLMIEHHVRPTLLTPLWHVGGYALGALTAAISEKAAHACTIAVEEVIEEHYQKQIDALSQEKSPMAASLKDTFQQFQREEIHHKEIATQQGGEEAPLYPVLTGIIKTLSRAAIWASERI